MYIRSGRIIRDPVESPVIWKYKNKIFEKDPAQSRSLAFKQILKAFINFLPIPGFTT